MTTTWTPKIWADTQHDMPNIPVVDGMTQHAYGEALESFGENRDDRSITSGGKGYGERISVVYDPATGNLGVVTQWEWNSPVLSYIWTAEGLDFHGLWWSFRVASGLARRRTARPWTCVVGANGWVTCSCAPAAASTVREITAGQGAAE